MLARKKKLKTLTKGLPEWGKNLPDNVSVVWRDNLAEINYIYQITYSNEESILLIIHLIFDSFMNVWSYLHMKQ